MKKKLVFSIIILSIATFFIINIACEKKNKNEKDVSFSSEENTLNLAKDISESSFENKEGSTFSQSNQCTMVLNKEISSVSSVE